MRPRREPSNARGIRPQAAGAQAGLNFPNKTTSVRWESLESTCRTGKPVVHGECSRRVLTGGREFGLASTSSGESPQRAPGESHEYSEFWLAQLSSGEAPPQRALGVCSRVLIVTAGLNFPQEGPSVRSGSLKSTRRKIGLAQLSSGGLPVRAGGDSRILIVPDGFHFPQE